MRSLILSIGLVLVIAISLGCDSDNNAVGQTPGPATPSGTTTVNGTVTDTDGQCSGAVEGFNFGDSVTVQLFAGTDDFDPTGQISNNTNDFFAECSTDFGVITDNLPFSAMVCKIANSRFPGLSNGDFMSMLVSFTWLDGFIDNVDKTVVIVDGDIGIMSNTQNLPCARVKIDNISASN